MTKRLSSRPEDFSRPIAGSRVPSTPRSACHRSPSAAHGCEGSTDARRPPSSRVERRLLNSSRVFSPTATSHPAAIPQKVAGRSRPYPQTPPRSGRKALLTAGIPAYPRPGRKRQDRPVTPKVAGSNPVVPVKDLQSRRPTVRVRQGALRFRDAAIRRARNTRAPEDVEEAYDVSGSLRHRRQ
jgi:hypothetical protein